MSEVNQAFLRAYLKNRTQNQSKVADSNPATSSHHQPPFAPQHTTASAPDDQPTRPRVNPNRPSSSSHDRATRVMENGMQLRIDPSHQQTNLASPATNNQNLESKSAKQNTSVPQNKRQGIWGPLGPERGMKAMEPVSIPAIVSNGIVPVSDEATRMRRPMANSETRPVAEGVRSQTLESHNTSQAPAQRVPETKVQYEQVLYIDGLSGAPSQPHLSRPTKHSLQEISQSISVGTGLPQGTTSTSSWTGSDRLSSSIDTPESSGNEPRTSANVVVNRRFDGPHSKSGPITKVNEPAPKPPEDDFSHTAEDDAKEIKLNRIPSAAPESDGTSRGTLPLPQNRYSSPSIDPALKQQPPIPLPVAFTPSWEVDTFFWPEVVKRIETVHKDAFRQISKHLQIANRDGLKVMAITSGERGVGRSTVAMHMARCAAASGLKVALVDGDTFCPSLVDQLRLDIRHGWQDCLFENVPLSEVAVHSLQDNLTLFPLTAAIPAHQMHANLHRMTKMIKRISTAFEMVFIDSSRLNLEQRDLVGVGQESIIDAAIVVVDTELSIKEKVDSAVGILQGMGISSIGLVENFQS